MSNLIEIRPEDMSKDKYGEYVQEDYVNVGYKLPERYRHAHTLTTESKAWADRITDGAEPTNLVFFGATGRGKTYSACATGTYLQTISPFAFRNRAATGLVFKGYSSLLRELKKFEDKESVEEAWFQVLNAYVLILDDLFRLNSSEYDMGIAEEILDHRVNRMVPTIVTTHHSMTALTKAIDPHFLGRLMGGATMTVMEGGDRRTATL